MNTATHPDALARPPVPVIRITPPDRWWVLPFGELWEYRELLYFFVWRELKVRYKQTVVGAAWAVIQPFLTMLIFSLFFGKLAHIPSGGLPYPVFYYSALLPWMYFASSLQNATNKIVENQNVITKVYFPRLVLPISAVLSGLVDFAISFLMFVAIMIYYRIHPGWPRPDASGFPAACRADGSGRRSLAFGAERDLSRRPLRRPISRAILDVCLAGRVSQLARAHEMALALRVESHGRRDRGLSLVTHGLRQSAGPHVSRVLHCGTRGPCVRPYVFSEDGNHDGRCGVKRATRRFAPTPFLLLNRHIGFDKPVDFVECAP